MSLKLKFGLSQLNKHAPVWLINSASVLALVIATKQYLITGLPIQNEDIKEVITIWTDYFLDVIQVGLAISVIFFGENKIKE